MDGWIKSCHDNHPDSYFLATNHSTIEEVYYQRAAENDENVFTFSVPFNPGAKLIISH